MEEGDCLSGTVKEFDSC